MLRSPLCVVLCLIARAPAWATTGECEAIARLELADVERISAERVPAGAFTAPDEKPVAGDLPAFCRVRILISPRIHSEVWLPETGWNERFHGRGVGGFGGVIAYTNLAQALRSGFATAATDTGHPASDKHWAMSADGQVKMSALEDYGWRSTHDTAVKAKAIIAAYYGRKPKYSYFSGCSGGGRQGLIEVERFPEDYDGVLAGCSANPFSRELLSFLWPQVVMRERLGGPIAEAKLKALTEAVVRACDGNDGKSDGVVDDPRRCEFDPARVGCEAQASPTCLSGAEVAAVIEIWNGPRSKSGRQIWFSVDKTVHSAMWRRQAYPLAIDYLRWVTGNPEEDWRDITRANFETYVERASRKLGPALDADQGNIDAFVARGGKLLLWHGEADWAEPAADSIHYFQRVLTNAREPSSARKAIRLFLLPGVPHCNIEYETQKASSVMFPSTSSDVGEMSGVFPDRMFAALVSWVESGITPERIIATRPFPESAEKILQQ